MSHHSVSSILLGSFLICLGVLRAHAGWPRVDAKALGLLLFFIGLSQVLLGLGIG